MDIAIVGRSREKQQDLSASRERRQRLDLPTMGTVKIRSLRQNVPKQTHELNRDRGQQSGRRQAPSHRHDPRELRSARREVVGIGPRRAGGRCEPRHAACPGPGRVNCAHVRLQGCGAEGWLRLWAHRLSNHLEHFAPPLYFEASAAVIMLFRLGEWPDGRATRQTRRKTCIQ